MSGLAEETPRSIADTLPRPNVPPPRVDKCLRCRREMPGVLIAPDNATVSDMRFRTMSALEGAASLPIFGAALVEERRKRPYFRNTKNSEEI